MSINLDGLYRAIKRGDVTAVRAFIASGGSVSTPDPRHRWTPLEAAAYRGNAVLVRLLVDAGADVNATLFGICTPLELAAMAGSFSAVKVLLERGANTEHDGVSCAERLRGMGYGDRTRILEAIERAHNGQL